MSNRQTRQEDAYVRETGRRRDRGTDCRDGLFVIQMVHILYGISFSPCMVVPVENASAYTTVFASLPLRMAAFCHLSRSEEPLLSALLPKSPGEKKREY